MKEQSVRREAGWRTALPRREKPAESLQRSMMSRRWWSPPGCCRSDCWSRTRTQTLVCRLPGNHPDRSLCQNSPRHPGPTVSRFWSSAGRQNPPAQVRQKRWARCSSYQLTREHQLYQWIPVKLILFLPSNSRNKLDALLEQDDKPVCQTTEKPN